MNILFVSLIVTSLFFCLILLCGKKNGRRIALCLIVTLILGEMAFVHVRNRSLSFDTPEKAFAAIYLGAKNNSAIAIGDASAFIAENHEGDVKYAIVEKAGDKWRIGSQLTIHSTCVFLDEKVSVVLFYKEGINDYYIDVTLLVDGNHSVHDNCGSIFQCISRNGSETHFAFLQNRRKDYSISIDGTLIEIDLGHKVGQGTVP